MKRSAEAVVKDARTVLEADRADIGGVLLNSLEPGDEADIEAGWRQEVAARVDALDAGEVETIPWTEVRNGLVARLKCHGVD